MEDKTSIVITDLDGTFVRSSLHEMLMVALIREDIFGQHLGEQYYALREKWKNRATLFAYEEFSRTSVEIMVTHLKGVSFEKVKSISDKIIEASWNYTYTFPRWLYEEARAAGYDVGAISHSPDFMVERFCSLHKFSFGEGSPYLKDEAGLFTKDITAVDKRITIEKVLSKNPSYTLDQSIGLGDTMGDLPIFESVEHPICFNPTLDLARHAKQKGWPIVVERKNLVLVNGEVFDKDTTSLSRFIEQCFD